MRSEFRILLEIAGDVLVALGLFLLACLGSGWCQANLTPNVELYTTWFAIWMVPFCVYAVRRNAFECDIREFAVFWVLITFGLQAMRFMGLPPEGRWIMLAGFFNLIGSAWVTSKLCHNKPPAQDQQLVDENGSSDC
jgi:hypothetical protein